MFKGTPFCHQEKPGQFRDNYDAIFRKGGLKDHEVAADLTDAAAPTPTDLYGDPVEMLTRAARGRQAS